MSDDVPFYLMPVAAVLGMLAAFATVRLLYLTFSNLTKKNGTSPYAATTPRSTYLILIITIIASLLTYAKVVASVNNAMSASSHALFDPYELLQISESANATEIKQAYRNLSKIHHPDKGGSQEQFQNVHLAYQALTDETAMMNYQQYGHPEGPPSHASLDFALPKWLLHPQGNVVFVLLFLYLGMFVAIIYAAIRFVRKENKNAAGVTVGNSVALEDTMYLASHLTPDTKHLNVLYMIATTPENIRIAQESLKKIALLKKERLKESSLPKKEPAFDLMDDGGWADDDEDEDEAAKQAALKARELEEQQEKERKELAAAQGTATVLLEGIDNGVIGQAWVERTLANQEKWPPETLGFLEEQLFEYNGKQVTAMEHAAIRRNLCMTMGRLNSIILNGHSELLEAGSKGLIDKTYFEATAEFRKRAGLLLEAALRTAIALKSYRLAKTIVETVTMFKIGTLMPTDPKTIKWFEGIMNRQYGCMPKLALTNLNVFTDDEEEIATNDTCTLEMDMERLHAENFTKQKVAMCQKQGIPPQVALQTYREGWWVMVRAEKVDGGKAPAIEYKPVNDQMKMLLSNVDVEIFASEEQENQLLAAWPLIVQNCAQKNGKVKLNFKAPSLPGKYRFHIAVMSQEFLGADQQLTCERVIVDEETVKRPEEEEEVEEEGEEAKKDK